MEYTEKERQRFWSKVARGKAAECWHWTAATSPEGYGRVGIQGKVFQAHRVAYELFYGTLPGNAAIRQTCGNRTCCNPRHLTGGLRADHAARTHRQKVLGELHPQVSIPDSEVRRIRERFAAGEASQVELAVEYKVSQAWICMVVRGERRAKAGGPLTFRGRGRAVGSIA